MSPPPAAAAALFCVYMHSTPSDLDHHHKPSPLFTHPHPGLRPLFHPECTLLWLGMYGCDAADKAAREAFLAKVEAYYSEF